MICKYWLWAGGCWYGPTFFFCSGLEVECSYSFTTEDSGLHNKHINMAEGDIWNMILWTFKVERTWSWSSFMVYVNIWGNSNFGGFYWTPDGSIPYFSFAKHAFSFWFGSLFTASWFLLLPSRLYKSTGSNFGAFLIIFPILKGLFLNQDLLRADFKWKRSLCVLFKI